MTIVLHRIPEPLRGAFLFARQTGDVIPGSSPSSLRDEERRLGFDEEGEKNDNEEMTPPRKENL
jgi:hypothetical protein